MITDLFLSFFEISMVVSLIVLSFVLSAPLLNKRYGAKWKYFMWIFLALRLLIPLNGNSVRILVDEAADFMVSGNGQGEKDLELMPVGEAQPRQWVTVEIPRRMTDPVVLLSEGSVSKITLLDIVAYVWLGGCLCILAVYLFSYIHYRIRLGNEGILVEDSVVLDQRERLLAEMRIKNRVPVVEYAEADSPMIIGFVKPILVLPRGQYSAEELYYILKHELVHLKRHDIYLKSLLVAANMVHWFNPAIWLMRKEAVVDMELSCDERVIQGMGFAERKAYTETLISTLHKNCGKKAVISTQFYGGKQVMKKRLKNILIKAKSRNGLWLPVCAVILTVSLSTLVGCSAAKSGQASAEGNDAGSGQAVSGGNDADSGQASAEGNDAGSGQAVSGGNDANSGQASSKGNDADFSQASPKGEDPDFARASSEREGVYTGQAAAENAGNGSGQSAEGMSPADPEGIDSLFWSLDGTQGTVKSNVLTFSTGLQLILPAEWQDRAAMSVAPDESGNGEMLILSTKDTTEDGIGNVLFYLRYVSGEGYNADDPYSIYGRETDRVLGIYHWDGKEYALIFEVPQLYYMGVDAQTFNEILQDNRDLSESVSEVEIVTEGMRNFTECGLEDLDWMVSWQSVIEALN